MKKKKIISLLAGLTGGLVFFPSCLFPGRMGEGDQTPAAMAEIAKASNRFAFALYERLREEEGNHFFSPLSLSLALAMTAEGAREQTAEEIIKVFSLPPDESNRRDGFSQILKALKRPNSKSELRLANALWIQKDYALLPQFLEAIEWFYEGKAASVDFIRATEEARKTINEWTEAQTAGKIKDLFPPGILNRLTRLVLTNAIYFRGLWHLQFEEKETRPEKFRLSDGREVDVPMMRLTGERIKFPYMESEELQMLEMPYEGKELSMLILLPRKDHLEPLEKILTLEKLEEWKRQLAEQRVDVFFPRFKLKAKYFLKEKLAAMGLLTAFTDKADFSGINGKKDLLLQAVIHQAYVEVNEQGTEAAGATGVSIGLTAYSPRKIPVFRADHPFLFLLQEKKTGSILFLGRLTDPSS